MSFTVRWCIENFFLYWKNRKEALVSPELIVGCLNNTKWSLCLYKNELWSGNYIGIFLQPTDAFLESFDVDFQLSILASDGTSLKTYEVTQKSLLSGVGIENSQFLEQNDVLLKQRAEFLPEETLTVQCQLWNNDMRKSDSENCFIRTRVEVEQKEFIGDVEGFSFLQANQKIPIVLRSDVNNKPLISINITVSDACGGEHITIEINPIYGLKMKMSSCKYYILDTTGKKVECGQDEESFGSPSKFLLFLTKSQLMARNLRYLPNDVLTLGCECIFLTGVISQRLEQNNSGLDFSPAISHVNGNEMLATNTEGPLYCTNDLRNDMQCLYNDGFFSDVKLRIDTETFTAHRLILSARSPVFKAMFSNDMKEKTKECVDVPDIDSATGRRLLLYLYTDSLENLQWEPASQLYVAADKYAVLSLRNKCSSILKRNLCPSNACGILVLADMHNDVDLKTHVQNFILDHDQVLLLSDEWKDFMKGYLHLASEIMYMDLERKIGHKKI
ncbi:TD and POZ domain-containing protein 5 [Araneus ventricosus]|uniref:TD and POZ domain-containing protein 5 n=1 Tax=Araneus ventricosus TaxID=182803 RepID=A0A4Y2N8T5_ARAVE|nr:TD and POZ domain-containing protein 5 [Araneus ventricosus]